MLSRGGRYVDPLSFPSSSELKRTGCKHVITVQGLCLKQPSYVNRNLKTQQALGRKQPLSRGWSKVR